MEESKKLVGHVCLEAYKRLLDECLRFQSAELYFSTLELAALHESPTKDARVQLMKYLTPNYASPREYFIESLFIMLVAYFEFFLQEIVRTIVMAHPKKVGQVEFKLSEILDAESTDELVRQGIESTLNKLMYKKPSEYLDEVAKLLSINANPLMSNWNIFIEAKARRDLGVHNGWRCNATYLRKVAEIGVPSTYALGERVFPPPDDYLKQVSDNLSILAEGLMSAVGKAHKTTLYRPAK